MLDVAVGIVVFLFLLLGFREGIVKSLCSVAVVFISLFFASSVLSFLAKAEPRFAEPSFMGAVIVFLLVWTISFVAMDLLLTLLFKKIINVIILGPVDKVGGTLIGGLKGFLICGIVLQLFMALPVLSEMKNDFKQRPLSRFSIAVYQWSYTYAKKLVPMINNLNQKENIVEKIGEQENLKNMPNTINTKDILNNVGELEKIKDEQSKKVKQLLKDQKLLHGAPERRIEDNR